MHTQSTYFHDNCPVAHVLSHQLHGTPAGSVVASLSQIRVAPEQEDMMKKRALSIKLSLWPAMSQKKTVWEVFIFMLMLRVLIDVCAVDEHVRTHVGG